MQSKENNPDTNVLCNGVDEQKILKAVRTSGYPLQTVVYEKLSKYFYIQEEWCFVDSESNVERAIDLLAQRRLYDFKEPQPRIRPTLNLVIECKQSDLPYVFFLTNNNPSTPKFPVIAGLASNNISLTSDDDPSTWDFSVLDLLELREHKFLGESAIFCNTFSKGARKGSDIELSGSQSYQGLVQPLLKATSHFKECEKPPKTAYYFDCHITIPIAVIDGPMVGVRRDGDDNKLEMLPWVRLSKHQALNTDIRYHHMNISAIDIVHKDFLEEYIVKHLLPFSDDFSKLALKHHDVLADGKGFVSGMGKDSWNGIEARLEKRAIKHTSKRTYAIFHNIIKYFKNG